MHRLIKGRWVFSVALAKMQSRFKSSRSFPSIGSLSSPSSFLVESLYTFLFSTIAFVLEYSPVSNVNDRQIDMIKLADKYEVRDYVRECGLDEILIPQYGLWYNMDEVEFDKLPNSFILKPTHGSGDVVVVRDKANADIDGIKRRIQEELDVHMITSSAELHYGRIPHRVVAEQLLLNQISILAHPARILSPSASKTTVTFAGLLPLTLLPSFQTLTTVTLIKLIS